MSRALNDAFWRDQRRKLENGAGLKVLLDGRNLQRYSSGGTLGNPLVRYVVALLQEMVEVDSDIELSLVFSRNTISDEAVDLLGHPRVSGTHLFAGRMPAIVWEQTRLPRFLNRLRGAQLFHSPRYTLPLGARLPTVVTIHDISYDLYPQWYTRRQRLSLTPWSRLSAWKASAVVTDTEVMKRSISTQYRIPSAKIRVIPLAAPPSYLPTDPSMRTRLRAGFGFARPVILAVGRIEPRRNYDILLAAFEAVRAAGTDCELVIVGRDSTGKAGFEAALAESGVKGDVRCLADLPDETLRDLYQAADVFAYLSTYEGFGLPLIEAMACGLPVVTPHVSVMPEVGGDAPVYVAPRSVADTARALDGLITNAESRAGRGRLSAARASEFSWKRAATQTIEIYHQVARIQG